MTDTRAKRPSKELWDLYCEDEVTEVFNHSDTSYRHGTYETVVVKDADGRFWKGFYSLSGDGEENDWREGYAEDFTEVFPYTKTVTEYQ